MLDALLKKVFQDALIDSRKTQENPNNVPSTERFDDE